MSEIKNNSRRKFLKKTAYVVPVVMTMHAAPSLAGHGSKKKEYIKKGKEYNKPKKTFSRGNSGKFSKVSSKNNKKGHR